MRRVVALSFGLVCAGKASAQVDGELFNDAYRTLLNHQLVKITSGNPTLLSGFPGLPAKKTTDPDELGQEKAFRLIHADHQRKKGDKIELEGNCAFLVQGYRVLADKVVGSLKTKVFTLTGNVSIDGVDMVVSGHEITIDFVHENYLAQDTQSQIDPKLLQGHLTDKLYVKGRESSGDRYRTITYNGDFTTCNLEQPHFDIESESSDVKPGKRAILRNAKIRLFGRTIVKVPYLLIPLDDRNYKNLPVVGQSEDEGYYIKETWAIPLKGDNYLVTHEDYMSKLGLGLGADYYYNQRNSNGVAKLYKIFGTGKTITFSNDHRQTFSWGSINIANDYQQDNYLTSPGTTQLSSRAVFTLPQGDRGTDRISFSRSSSSASGYSTVSQTIGLNDQRFFGPTARTNLDLNLLDNKSSSTGFSSENRQLDVRFKGDKEVALGTASLEYQRLVPIGDTKGSSGSSDRTPVLTFQSDAKRLLGDSAAKAFPFRTSLAWGQYQDPLKGDPITRTSFDFNFNKVGNSPSRFNIDYSGDFKQSIYSDDLAQYILNFGTAVRYSLGNDTGLNFRYNYLRPYGSSPLPLDRTGRTNFVSMDLSARPIKSFLIGAQTGYDILSIESKYVNGVQVGKNTGWQQVGVRTEYHPNGRFLARGLYSYDTFNRIWNNARLDLSYASGETLISFGSRYDGVAHTWSNANLYMENLTIGRLKISAALTYNGYLKEFDNRQYNLIYDLHCAEAILSVQETTTGFRPGRQIQFLMRIKALPFDLPFGAGTRGQPIGYGTGRDF